MNCNEKDIQKKRLVILGSTGSIGTQALDVVREQGDIEVVGLAAGKNVKLIEQQIREFKPKYAVLYDENAASELALAVQDTDVKVLSGMDGLVELASYSDYDMILTAVVGMIGIRPTIAAIKNKKTIALANKETMVTAGHIITRLASENGVSILPVDSEHSAIFQSLNGNPHNRIKRILLTASGGPFRNKTLKELENVTVMDALKHPNWSMGKKITIDSATMVNKGLEVMEAKWLFDVSYDDIKVVVHPESILHSAVEYVDGAVIGQMGVPDMKLPIQYAFYYPDRRPMEGNKLDLFSVSRLNFFEPDYDTFSGLKLAIEVGKKGGSLPTVFNAANEKAVALFLDNKITFTRIYDLIEKSVSRHAFVDNPTLDQILEAEKDTYDYIDSILR